MDLSSFQPYSACWLDYRFVALVKDSDPGDNQFGPNPKGVANVAYQAPQQPYGAPAQTYMPPQPAEPRLHSHSLQLLLFSLLNPLRHLLPHLRQSPLPLPRQAPHTAQAAGLRFRSAAIIARTAAHP
jgi:hypothetical protein